MKYFHTVLQLICCAAVLTIVVKHGVTFHDWEYWAAVLALVVYGCSSYSEGQEKGMK